MKGREKMKKKKKNNHEENQEDRLSQLPDDLLHQILSFLNTKYSVQTSVLSKRWVFLWKSLPYLDFNYDTFPYKTSLSEDCKVISFHHFILHVVFRRRPSNIVKVRYNYLQHKPDRVALMLISYAIEHKVQELEVNLESCTKSITLPLSFYTCESLTTIKLNNGVNLPKALAFPALKSLHLYGFLMTDENFDPRIFSGCPNLENLKLVGILFGNLKKFSIVGLNLRNLELLFLREVSLSCKVVIHTPRLTSFKYDGYASTLFFTVNLVSLDRVCVNMHWNPFLTKQEDALCLINMLKQFRQAKFLSLSVSTIKVLFTFPGLLEDGQLQFINLNYLLSKLGSGCVNIIDNLGLSLATPSQTSFCWQLAAQGNPFVNLKNRFQADHNFH